MKALQNGLNTWVIFSDLMAGSADAATAVVLARPFANPNAQPMAVEVADYSDNGNYVQVFLSVDLPPDNYRLSLYQGEDPDNLLLLHSELATLTS